MVALDHDISRYPKAMMWKVARIKRGDFRGEMSVLETGR